MANKELTAELKEIISAQAVKEMDSDCKFKQPRMDDVKKNEDLYANKPEPALPGQFSIPLPIMGGFVDTLVSELNQPVRVTFGKTEMGDLQKAERATAGWEYDSSPTRGAWNIKDLRGKKLASMSGRAIYNIFAESEPVYKSYLRNVHHYNFYIDPRGGADIEAAQHLGELNLFKTEYDLKQGGMSQHYDKDQVTKLLNALTPELLKKGGDTYNNIANAFRSVGLNPEMMAAPSGKMAAMVQHYTTYEGVRYYVLFEPITKIWVRIERLDKIFTRRKKPKWPYKSWATHDDPANFWSKAPADDVRPVAISMKEAFDQSFNELLQRIRGKRAVDPNYFPNRAELEDFTTRFVEAKVPAGKNLRDGFVEFTTPDNTAVTINIMQFLDSFLGQKTGVTPGSQGQAQEDKVGIYYGNIQQVARRMNLYSDFYKQCYAELGEAWLDGAQEHMKGKISVRILGANGYESAEITRTDIQFDTDPDINIQGGADDKTLNQELNTKKETALARAMQNPVILQQYNPKWIAEQNVIIAGWDPEEVKRALDTDTYGDQKVIAAAYAAISLIEEGEEPMKNRRANPAFLQTISDYLDDHPELDDATYNKILDYWQMHVEIALQNEVRKKMAAPAPGMPGAPGMMPAGAAPAGMGGGAIPTAEMPALSTASPQGGVL